MTAGATSIVLITRNQAWNVDAAILAAVAELGRCGGGELIVVDSASSDGTLDFSAPHPVGLVELAGSQLLTPSLGRWLGTQLAGGDAVLFLDGDMRLAAGWLSEALCALEDATVGCVTGRLVWGDDLQQVDATESQARDVPWFQGAALIRRSVLEQAGTFNPVLRSEEESELSTRIRAAGYRIVCLDRAVATHPASTGNPIGDILARRRRGLYLGFGQVLKLHGAAPSRLEYLRRRAFWIPPALAVVGALLALAASLRSRSRTPLLAAGAVGSVLAAQLAHRKGGMLHATASLATRTAILEGTIRGIVLPAHPPPEFTPAFRVLREAPRINGHT